MSFSVFLAPGDVEGRRTLSSRFIIAFFACLVVAIPVRAETIKIALPRLLPYPAVPIAIARGYFKEQGLDARMVYLENTETAAIAVASGNVDFAVSALGAAFYTLAARGRIRILASSAIEQPGFYNLVFVGARNAYAAGLTSAHFLAGHSFAITQIGGSQQYALGLLAEKDKFSLHEIALRPLSTIPNIISALAGNDVDAAVLPAPPALPSLDRGTIKLLGWASDLVPGWMEGAAYTSARHADDDPDLVRRFLIAYRRGAQDYHDAFAGTDNTRQDGDATPGMLALLAKFTGIAAPLIERAPPYIDGEGRVLMSDLARQIAWYRARGMVKAALDAAAVVDRRYAIPMPEGK